MWRRVLALIGVLIFIGGIVFLTVEVSQQQAEIAERGLETGIRFAQVFDYPATIIAGIGILLGPILTVPWWIEYFRQESQWYEKRDEPLDGPPRVPN
ncbi:MAG: hypothetical protein ACOC9Z_04610 [Chloroflexota bacterium]